MSNNTMVELVKSKDGFQKVTVFSVFSVLLVVFAWSFLLSPAHGGPYVEIMAMFSPRTAFFAGLGLLLMVLLPNTCSVSFRGGASAFALVAIFTSFMWLSL